MKRSRSFGMKRHAVWSSLWLAAVTTARAAQNSKKFVVSVMDLSYKSHLGAQTLSTAISDTIRSTSPNEVELDVSFSELGNDGMELILQSLRPSSNDTWSEIPSHLTARMNRLTPEGATRIVAQLLGGEEKDTKSSDAMVKTVGNETNVTGKIAPLFLRSLDLGFNNLAPSETGAKSFHSSLRKLIETSAKCPPVLRLERCGLGPAACRAIGKGIVKRFESNKDSKPNRLSLSLCGNGAIGDSGAATIAAAIRSVTSSHESRKDADGSDESPVVFEVLDLSSCEIGDAGVEAIAMALRGHPGCVRHLNLSHNRISDDGAAAIGNALASSRDAGCLESLDLSNNVDLSDRGASALAECLEKAVLRKLSVRSCKIRADGAQAFGCALARLAQRDMASTLDLDLSGNPLGVLRSKDKSGKKYSASVFKSKASATTASYVNFIGKKIRSGLKDAGLAAPASGESDDEEEELMGNNGSDDSDKSDSSKARCGLKAFASTLVVGEHDVDDEESESPRPSLSNILKCNLAVRHCTLDRSGADALAATVLQGKARLGIDLIIDSRMNPVLEEDMVDALRGEDPATLEEMTERHMVALEVLRVAEQRAAEASAAATERARHEASWDAEDDFGLNLDRFSDEGSDIDADYDDTGYY